MNNVTNNARSDRILVVDDTTANLQLLTNLLTEHGYTVHPASDGELALEFVRTTLPDLILLDIRMPGMDGYEVCRRLQADERTCPIPIIFISILEDESDKVKGFQEGAVDYITKPFRPEEVLARVRTHLRLRELTVRLEQKVSERTAELALANSELLDEIAERQKTEEALRKSEALLNAVQRLTKVGGWEYNIESGKSFWTDELYRIHEIPKDANIDHLKESLKCYRSEDRPIIQDAFRQACEKGELYDLQFPFITLKGRHLWIRTIAQPVYEEGKVVRLIGNLMDITERRLAEEALDRLNRELRAISNCNQVLIRAEDEQTLLTDICRIICDEAGYRMAWVGYAENDEAKTIRPVTWAGVEQGYLAETRLTWADTERGRGPAGKAIRTGESAVIQDFDKDPQAAPWRESALQRGYRSCLGLCLKDDCANPFGVLVIYSTEPNVFTPDEILLLEELTGDLAFGITVLRARIERKRVEEALKESEANYSDLYENAPDMYVSVNAKTALIEKCNQTLVNTLGYPKEEIIGRPLFEIYHPDCLEEAKKTFKVLIETGTIHDKELQLQRKDGSGLDVSLSVSSVRGDSGDILHSRSTLRDITERRRNYAINASRLHLMQFAVTHSLDELLEETLNEAENLTGSLIGFYHFIEEDQESLTLQNWSTRTKAHFCRAEGKGRHYAITEAGVWVDCVCQRKPVIQNEYASLPHRKGMPEGHAEIIRELVVPVLRGKTIKAILGVGNKQTDYVENDVVAISLLADLAWEIAERKQVDEALRKLNEELEQRVMQRTAELERKSDELHDSQMALINIVEDLNEQTAELEQANTKLQELDRLKSMFIASMSHELRTPLNSIIGFSSILCEEWLGPLNAEQKKNLETVLRSGRHLLALINDVIDVSKIEAGKMATSCEVFDLYDVMVETAELFVKEAGDKGLAFTVEPLHQNIRTDRKRLCQCLINLMGNAVKFTERGFVKTTAHILQAGGEGPGQGMIELTVEDTGLGIREEDLGQLFEAFVRLKTPSTLNIQGTGLGLYLTRKITNELLLGDVEVRSSFGKGSRFFLRIPVQREEGFNEKSARC